MNLLWQRALTATTTLSLTTFLLASTTNTAVALPPPPLKPAPLATVISGDNSVQTLSTSGTINRNNPFFQALGNGRSCESCHQESQAWSITPSALQTRFNASNGTDAIFKLVDGANSPNERTATLAQRQVAYSMLLKYGVIRVGLPMPTVADFSLQLVDDPYGYASAQEMSFFRRPLPSTNLKFLSTVMWDGRETQAGNTNCLLGTALCFAPLATSLSHQANSAVKGHAQLAAGLTDSQIQAIVNFESSLTTAKTTDSVMGNLNSNGGQGGASALAATNSYFGLNDAFAGDYRTGANFNRHVFSLYNAWEPPAPQAPSPAGLTAAQAAIGRGQMIFNTRPFAITGVNGFNDVLRQPTIQGSCASCHSNPNVGNTSVPHFMNTGTAALPLRNTDQPLYTLRNNATGAVIQTTDLGLATQTGKWSDMSKFKVPSLRGLAGHAPYFHDGHAQDLQAVVGFYNKRFNMNLNPQEMADLTAFLKAL